MQLYIEHLMVFLSMSKQVAQVGNPGAGAAPGEKEGGPTSHWEDELEGGGGVMGPKEHTNMKYEASVYKELIVCNSSSCAHVSHPREITETVGLGAIPGGWKECYVEKRENAVILSFPLLREGRVVVIIKKAGTTVWW
jgi:hypothetical protein